MDKQVVIFKMFCRWNLTQDMNLKYAMMRHFKFWTNLHLPNIQVMLIQLEKEIKSPSQPSFFKYYFLNYCTFPLLCGLQIQIRFGSQKNSFACTQSLQVYTYIFILTRSSRGKDSFSFPLHSNQIYGPSSPFPIQWLFALS